MSVFDRKSQRMRRHTRIRKKVSGTAERPRFCVSITTNHIYCQFIDDVTGRTLANTSSLSAQFKAENARPNMDGAALLGKLAAEAAKAANVTEGFKKELAIVGVGYKAALQGKVLNLSLGYSHPINFQIPQGIKITVTPENKIIVEGCDKQLVGETAAQIRRYRSPEPYKGKGIRYVDERIVLKEGKSVG